MDIQRFKLQLLTASCREAVVCGWFNRTMCDRGVVFGGTFLFAAPLSCMKQVPFESTGIGLQYVQKLSVYSNNSLRYVH